MTDEEKKPTVLNKDNIVEYIAMVGERMNEASIPTKDQDDRDVMYKTLEVIIPAFGKLPLAVARLLLGRINDCLSDTPFAYFIFGDGVKVVRKEQMYNLNKALFNADTFQDDREKEHDAT